MPRGCLFSPRNHSPERDFIKHLPYDLGDSQRLQPPVQGYSSGSTKAASRSRSEPLPTARPVATSCSATRSRRKRHPTASTHPFRRTGIRSRFISQACHSCRRPRCRTLPSSARTTPISPCCGPILKRSGAKSRDWIRPRCPPANSSTRRPNPLTVQVLDMNPCTSAHGVRTDGSDRHWKSRNALAGTTVLPSLTRPGSQTYSA